jgi:hypothetical protein
VQTRERAQIQSRVLYVRSSQEKMWST